jgi:SAM-dependent methyltransferase
MLQAMSVHAWLRWSAVASLLPRDIEDVLEIGTGLGAFGAMLNERFDYLGLEPDERCQRLANARTQGRVLRRAIEDHDGTYDLVCAFEVLEHTEDDVAALRLWGQHTRAWILVSVPMNPERFGPTDVHAGHFRRYTREGLEATLRESGFVPHTIAAYGFPAGYLLETGRNVLVSRRASARSLNDRTAASGRWLQPPPFMRALTWAIALPMRVVQRPFASGEQGTGLVALARRTHPA